MPQQRKWPKRVRRAALWGFAAFAAVIIVAGIVARLFFHGERLAELVQSQLNSRFRGRIEIAAIDWAVSDIPSALAGRWIDVEIRGVKVLDAQGDTVLDAPYAKAQMRPALAVFEPRSLVFRRIYIPGGQVLIQEEPQPYPESPDDLAVVTLVSAFYPKTQPVPQARKEPGITFDLQSFRLEQIDVALAFPGWAAQFDDVGGAGWLYNASPTGHKRDTLFSFLLKEVSAPTGMLTIDGVAPIALHDIRVPQVGQVGDPKLARRADHAVNLDLELLAETTDNAQVKIHCGMLNYYNNSAGGDYDILLDISHAGTLAETLSGGLVRGADLRGTLSISGNRRAPNYALTVTEAAVAAPLSTTDPPLEMYIETTGASWSSSQRTGKLTETVARGAGGQARLAANFQATNEAFTYDATIAIPQPIDLSPWLTPQARELAGGRLRGVLQLHSLPDGVRVHDIDLHMGPARVRGALRYSAGDQLNLEGLQVSLGDSSARTSGLVDLAERTLAITVQFTANDLPRWLKKYRQPAIATSAGGRARVTGSFDNLTIPSAELWAAGIPVMGRLSADKISFRDGRLQLPSLSSRTHGGSVQGSAELDFSGTPRIVDLRVGAIGLDLSTLTGADDLISGSGNFSAQASGPLAAPTSTFVAEVDTFTVGGDPFQDLLVTGGTLPDGSATMQLHVDRQRGGRLDINGSVGRTGELAGVLSARELPLHTLPGVANPNGDSSFGGVANAELALSGTVDKPTADGYVQIAKSWFRQSFLGAAELSLERSGDGTMKLAGNAFQGKFTIDGELSSSPEFSLRLGIGFQRIEFDQFFPELAAKHQVRGWASGTIKELVIRPGHALTLRAELTEFVVLMDNEDERGRPQPLRVRSMNAVKLAYDGTTATLESTAHLRGPTGDFTLKGSLSEQVVDVKLHGSVDVALLQPYLRDTFEEATGIVNADVSITGSLEDWHLLGVLEIANVNLRPIGQDAQVRIPAVTPEEPDEQLPEAARLEITNERIIFTGFTVEVDDEITGEATRMYVTGAVGLTDFEPTQWGVIVDGKLSGKLLLVLLPETFSAASGSAELSLQLLGRSAMPAINGSITFDDQHPITVTPRALRREILLNRGSVSFTDQLIEFLEIGGTIDDAGMLTNLSGELSLQDWQPVDVDVRVSAEALPYREPQTLELDLNIDDLRIVGDAEGLDISGSFDIIDGRYIRRFNPLLSALKPERVSESQEPFYESVPLLANANLNLSVSTGGGFSIDNNIAKIDLDGSVRITRTPRDPRIDGQIRVERGSFRFQGMRARFTRTEGTIQFSQFERLPDGTPVVDISTEADYRDSRGEEHVVVLELEGTLGALDWNLYTSNTGLNRVQTFSLIAMGRTTDETRALLGDEPVARKAGQIDGARTTDDGSGTFSAADELFKDIAGDFLSVLFEDPLKNFAHLDVFRIQVNTSAVGLHVEKFFGKNTRFMGDWELTLRGQTLSLGGEHRLSEGWSIETEYLDQEFNDETETDINNRVLFQMIFRGESR